MAIKCDNHYTRWRFGGNRRWADRLVRVFYRGAGTGGDGVLDLDVNLCGAEQGLAGGRENCLGAGDCVSSCVGRDSLFLYRAPKTVNAHTTEVNYALAPFQN